MMCVLCAEEDFYFLFLDRQLQAERAARGEATPASAGWLWPAFAQNGAASSSARANGDENTGKRSVFTCDRADGE
jgi:hypothetical protein